MDFVSYTYFAFLLAVFGLYYCLPHRLQNRMLLAASYVFYASWDPRFLALIATSTVCDFYCAQKIHDSPSRAVKRTALGVSLAVNLGILGYFKYCDFFLENFVALTGALGLSLSAPTLDIILPIGISFYTFQTLCYTIDVYRRQFRPVRNLADYALYVSFFPQLLAGPIERAANLLPQIQQPRQIDRDALREGFFLFYWGYFKKIFIADNLNVLSRLYAGPDALGSIDADGGLILISTYVYMFQLYADFSAYSDIARGTAKMMGFDIMRNFRTPFFSTNIQEMPKRWHISLTSWVLDYIYYPLAFSRWRGRHINVGFVTILTFLTMGLWHGPSWNYVIWGGYYGLLLVLYGSWRKRTRRWRRPVGPWAGRTLALLSVLLTFHFTVLGFLFFKSPDLGGLAWMLKQLVLEWQWSERAQLMAARALWFLIPLLAADLVQHRHEEDSYFYTLPAWLRWGLFYVSFYLMVMHAPKTASFVYFQF